MSLSTPVPSTSSLALSPEPVRPGDRVGLVSPSSAVPKKRLREAVALLESWGLVPVVGDHVLDTHPRAGSYLAGEDRDRAEDLRRAWLDDSLAAVFCMRGGYGAARILDLLDPAELRTARPKLLIGSSDITAIHEFWEHELNVVTLFAPMLGTGDLMGDPGNVAALKRALFSPIAGRVLTGPGVDPIVPGTAEGRIAGGNLSLLVMTAGAHPRDRVRADGRIVLLEDVTEDPYRIDGFLLTLLRSGYFEGARGIGLGTWVKCGPLQEIHAIAEEMLAPLGVPLLWGLPFGHGYGVDCVPLGARGRLVAEGASPRLDIVQ